MNINKLVGEVKVNNVVIKYNIEIDGKEEDVLEIARVIKVLKEAKTEEEVNKETLEVEGINETDIKVFGITLKSKSEVKFSLKELMEKITLIAKFLKRSKKGGKK